MYTWVVISHGIVEGSYLRSKTFLRNILSRFRSLHWVCKAHTELIVTSGNAVYCCSRRCQLEQIIVMWLSLIVTSVKDLYLISIESAVCIDLICCDLSCIIYTITILCIISCHRSDDTNLEGFLALCKYRYRCYCGYCHCCGCSNAEYFFQISHNKSPP